MGPHCCPSGAETLPWDNMNLLRKKSGWQPCLSPGPPAGQKLPWETCLWKRSFLISLHQLSQLFSSVGKESTCSAGDPSSIPGSGRSPGEEISYPLQYPGLENSRNYTVQGVQKSWTQLNDFHFHFLSTEDCAWESTRLVRLCRSPKCFSVTPEHQEAEAPCCPKLSAPSGRELFQVLRNLFPRLMIQTQRAECWAVRPWNFPGGNTGVGCHFLLQGVFPTQGWNPQLLCLRHCRQIPWPLSHQGSPVMVCTGGSVIHWFEFERSVREWIEFKRMDAHLEVQLGQWHLMMSHDYDDEDVT